MPVSYLPSLYTAFPHIDLVVVPLGADQPGIELQSHRRGAHAVLSLKAHAPVHCRVRPDCLLLGHLHHAGPRSRLDGVALATGMSFAVVPKRECDIILDRGTSASIVLTSSEARLDDGGLPGLSPLQGNLAPWSMSRALVDASLREAHEDVQRSLRRYDDDKSGDAFDRRIRALISRQITSSLSIEDEASPSPAVGHRCRYFIFRRAVEFMLDNLHKEIYISDLCEAALVSERTLRYAFEHVVGLSPTRYLFYLRLGSTCRDLMLSCPDKVSVASVALKRGMWDLSRFAGGYLRVFGEYPSDTLRRQLAVIA